MMERPVEQVHDRVQADEEPRPTPAGPGADEQLTVPEDREEAARAESRAAGDEPLEVLSGDEQRRFRERWDGLQTGFVDDPQGAAEQAHALIGEVLGRLTERHRALGDELRRGAEQGGDTEAMRLALRRCRALFSQVVAGG